MPEKVRITFYSVEKCGYYRSGNLKPEFCDLKLLLDELKEWGGDKEIGQTSTYTDNSETNSTYFISLVENDYSSLLTTWNEVPSTNGKVASVDPLSTVGKPNINLTDIPEHNIPGYAAYFWFFPDKNIFATIQFYRQLNGQRNLVKYLKSFMSKFTKYVVLDSDKKIIGYAQYPECDAEYFHPKFQTCLYPVMGKIDKIRQRRKEIRKIIRKDNIKIFIENNHQLFPDILALFGISNSSAIPEDMPFKYEISHTPSEDDLDTIIDDWLDNHDKSRDIGFIFEGEYSTNWIGHSMPRNDFEINIPGHNTELIDTNLLLSELVKIEKNILRSIKDE